jgi:succinate dehydrogenase / fumarate reductase cytochrome b subunit
MKRAGTLFSSSIGRKWMMAVTGLVLFGFVLAHMTGNLLVYLGPEALNEYGEFLREFLHGAGLWVARAVLLAAVALHIWAAISLSLENAAARPIGYRRVHHESSTYASRTMIWGGPILALFIVYHLLHFTTGQAHPSFVHGDVYHNFVVGFSNPIVVGVYVVAMLALGLHLYHGVWSMLQTMGLSHPRYDATRKTAAAAFAAVVVAGNVSMPVAVLAGIVR